MHKRVNNRDKHATNKGRELLINLIVLCVTIGFMLLIIEAGLQITENRLTTENDRPLYIADEERGYKLNSNVTARYSRSGVTITTNEDGYRYSFVEDPQDNILLLGDSFLAGFAVEDDEIMSARLQELVGQELKYIITESQDILKNNK